MLKFHLPLNLLLSNILKFYISLESLLNLPFNYPYFNLSEKSIKKNIITFMYILVHQYILNQLLCFSHLKVVILP